MLRPIAKAGSLLSMEDDKPVRGQATVVDIADAHSLGINWASIVSHE